MTAATPSPRPPEARKALLDILHAGDQGQLFLADLEDIGLLDRFEGDGAHLLPVTPKRGAQIDVDRNEYAGLARRPNSVALRGGAMGSPSSRLPTCRMRESRMMSVATSPAE